MANEVRLIKITLRNFKGAREFVLEPDGENMSVYGDNGTGKTTLFDAWNWLLFGKDSMNKADFDIKTNDKSGNTLHNLEHQVEGVLEVDGRRITLARVYQEVYTRKRGGGSEEFTGHTTNYFVNGVPVREAEYKERVAQITDETTLRLLTDPRYFNEQLKWEKRREILLQVCGGVSDMDVIAANRDLRDLPNILEGRNVDEHRKMVQAKRKAINDELKALPVRIDEATRALPEVTGDPAKIKAEIAKLNQERQERATELTSGDSGAALTDARRRLNEIAGKLLDAEQAARGAVDKAVQGEQARLNAVTDKAQDAGRTVRALQRTIPEHETEAKRLDGKLEKLREAFRQVKAQEHTFTQDETCPACGQVLPPEKLQAAQEAALAHFNQHKAEALEANKAEGKRTKEAFDAAQAALEADRANLAKAQQEQTEAEAEAAKIQQHIAKLRSEAPDPAKQPEYQKLQVAKREIEQEIQDIRAGNATAQQMVNDAVREFDDKIAALNGNLAKIAQREQGLKRIEQLQAEEKRLAAEYERWERELYLCEAFVEAQARMLDEHVNSHFIYARFRLFRKQINGGNEPACDCLYDGVPYPSMNNGARVRVGLDIINVLSRHYGFSAPIFVDNAESITNTSMVPVKAQMIRLVVSEPDKVLRVKQDDTALVAD